MIKKIKIETKPVTGKIDDSFIGIKIKNDTVNIFYPESYNFTDKNEYSFSNKCNKFIAFLKLCESNNNIFLSLFIKLLSDSKYS